MNEKDEKQTENKRTEGGKEKETPAQMIKVSLKRDHRHAGKNMKAGDKVDVPSGKLDYLKEKGVI